MSDIQANLINNLINSIEAYLNESKNEYTEDEFIAINKFINNIKNDFNKELEKFNMKNKEYEEYLKANQGN